MNEPRHESSHRSAEANGAVTENTPEGLLAEALRAKAGQTGGNAGVVADEPQTDHITMPSAAEQRVSGEAGTKDVSLGWVLVLAALLGLATGTLIGLLTVV